MTENSLKAKINSRYSVIDIIQFFVTTEFEVKKVGKSFRINPCPFTGNEKNSFALQRYDDGFEVYYMFSTDFIDEAYEKVPNCGTAYDLVKGLYPQKNEIQILSLLVSHQARAPIRKETRRFSPKKEELESIDPEIIADLQKSYIDQLKSSKIYYQYLEQNLKFNRETIEHFKIGCDGKRGVFTYPCFLKEELRHIRYKFKDKMFNLAHNSGGSWFFNEDGLDKDKVVLVEGEHDGIMIWQKYKIDAVALCGEMSAKSARYRKLRKLQGRAIYLAFDNDAAGKKFTRLFSDALSENNTVKVVAYEGKDPDECIKKGGELKIQ